MKKLAVNKEKTCMACMTCERVCAEAFYKTEDIQAENLSCIQIKGTDTSIKIEVCVQCGKCAKSCEAGAITQNAAGVYMLNKKTCVDCGKCVEACPFHLVVKAKSKPSPSKCIACGICAKNCPADVLYIAS
jgi:Fe-S-cluster-containing hydrogenase component 2